MTQKFDPKAFARAWFTAGRTADYVCPQCNASPVDFPEKCTAPLDEPCHGFCTIENARIEFETHWARRIR